VVFILPPFCPLGGVLISTHFKARKYTEALRRRTAAEKLLHRNTEFAALTPQLALEQPSVSIKVHRFGSWAQWFQR
jgi:hypothetical protein